MADRKAVIKNADMSEDMQQDAVDCASQALEKYNIEKVLNVFSHFKTHLTAYSPALQFYNAYNRTLRLTLRRNLTRSTTLLGTALSAATLAPTSPTKRSTLFISILARLQFCCSSLVNL